MEEFTNNELVLKSMFRGKTIQDVVINEEVRGFEFLFTDETLVVVRASFEDNELNLIATLHTPIEGDDITPEEILEREG